MLFVSCLKFAYLDFRGPKGHISSVGSSHVAIGSPKRKRRSKKSSPTSAAILPPLDIQQQTLHHHLTRRSAATARKAARVHTVPAMVLSGAAPKSTGISKNSSHPSPFSSSVRPRPHSANHPLHPHRQNQQGQEGSSSTTHHPTAHIGKTPSSSVLLSPIHHRERRIRHHAKGSSPNGTPERHYYHGHHRKVLCTPEKMARRREINKIETVRILRARPAFYPIKEKQTHDLEKLSAYSGHYPHRSGKSSAKLSDLKAILHANQSPNLFDDGSGAHSTNEPSFDLQTHGNPVLGKHITLRMDRAGDLKRKRRHNLVLPPATNLQQRQ